MNKQFVPLLAWLLITLMTVFAAATASAIPDCDGPRPSRICDPPDPPDPPEPPGSDPGSGPSEPSLFYYFGDLHSHTKFSDGASDIGDSFSITLRKIQDFKSAGVDPKINFMAITDHAGSLEADEFTQILQHASAHTDPNIPFIGIPGYEVSRWGGHENLFSVEDNGVVYAGNYPGGTWESIWPLEWFVRNHNNIVQLNHPYPYLGKDDRLDFFDFMQPDQTQVFDHTALIEIAHTNGEFWEPQYFHALDRGWHVAPTITSDWHDFNIAERWNSEGRTAVVTTHSWLTREDIYSAMRERRVYATEDRNLEIDFRINNRQMGSTLGTADNILNITIEVRDPDPDERIDRVELYSNNMVLLKRIDYAQGSQYRTSFEQPFLNLPGKYYFVLKAYESDGQRAWTAPIRVTKR